MVKVVEIEENVAVDEFGNRYNIKKDRRGANKKVWIEPENGNIADACLIKFSTRKEGQLSELNLFTEVVCSKICDHIGLSHVNYDLCQYTNAKGETELGVISQNYKKKQSHVEMNGKTLNTDYLGWYSDNNYGEIPDHPVNTVYTYIIQIKGRFESRRMTMSEQTENRLTEELLILALFDFCTCQIDRHWGNVGWIHNNIFEDLKFMIGLISIYDNECGFLLDEQTKEKLAELIADIKNPKKVQKVIDMINKKKYFSPYLGVKSPLVKIKDENAGFLTPLPSRENGKSNAEVLAEELAVEILKRPNLKAVYDRISEFNIDKMLDELDFIPKEYEEIKLVYSFVWKTRVKLLQKALEKAKKQINGEEQNEAGLSSL